MIDGGAMAQAVLYAIEYVALGVILLGFGFLALDAITPGKLGALIMHDRSINAAIVTAAGFIGLSAVIFTAIWTNSEGGVLSALVWTAVFGLLGIVLQLVAFLLLDLITPGKLREVVTEIPFHPASLIAASVQIGVSAIVIASIT